MEESDVIWMNGQLVPWHEATVHVLSHTLHYGSGAFEGIRFYHSDKGPAIYCLAAHVERLFYSAKALGLIIPYTLQALSEAIVNTVKVNKLSEGYIRPLVYSGYGNLKIGAKDNPVEVMIACWAMGEYMQAEGVNMKVSKYIRVHPDSTIADAKLVGNYVNGVLASQEIANSHYHEVLFLDYQGFIAEGAGDNIFLVKGNTLITPKSGNILPGITRKTVMELATDFGMTVERKQLTVDDLFNADEVFLTGTAVEVASVRSIDDTLIGKGTPGPVYQRIRAAYLDLVAGKNADYQHSLTYVC